MWQCPKCSHEFKNINQDHCCGKIETINQYIEEQPDEVQPILQKARDTIGTAGLKAQFSFRMINLLILS